MRRLLALAFVLLAVPASAQVSVIGIPPGSLAPPVIVFPASAVNGGGVMTIPLQLPDGSASAPSLTFTSESTLGIYRNSSLDLRIAGGGGDVFRFSAGNGFINSSAQYVAWGSSGVSTPDLFLTRDAANTLALRNGVNAQTFRIGPSTGYANIASANIVTIPTDSTSVEFGGVTRFRSSSTITPATAGVGNCGAAFQAAALTADCTIATLPAGMKLVAIYADVTVGFTCSGTCTGTKVMQAGTAAGGTQILAASLNVAVTGQFGLADADLGSGMTRAAAIQGGLIGSWSATTPVSVRFTSGTGNWGSGAATFVNAGSVKFTLITEQVK